jgi:hypothetical protein
MPASAGCCEIFGRRSRSPAMLVGSVDDGVWREMERVGRLGVRIEKPLRDEVGSLERC